jgi:predicted Zn-ribbon and HTH transcriptional regulator
MIEQQQIKLNGRDYLWVYDPNVTSAERSWSWIDERTYTIPAIGTCQDLTAVFLTRDFAAMASQANVSEKLRLFEILCSMGLPADEAAERLAISPPIRCRDCKRLTTDHYMDSRCPRCHERFVGASRSRNAGKWRSGGMSQ